MATQSQLNFVDDIEIGVKALLARNEHVTKITQVTDAAGRPLVELSAYVNRFSQSRQFDLIERLAEAFLKVNLAPTCIARALESAPEKQIDLETENIDSEPLKLEMHLPVVTSNEGSLEPIYGDEDPRIFQPMVPSVGDPSEPLQKIIQILLPYSKSIQHRVISTAGVWFGVGT